MKKLLNRKQIFFMIFLIFGILYSFLSDVPVTASYSVHTGDVWTYEVKAAKRTFEYSFGNFKSNIITRGYTLGGSLLNMSDQFNLSVLSIQNEPEKIIFELKSINSAITVESNASEVLTGIQGALGISILGSEFNFLENTSGLSAGDSFFICPNTLSWDLIFNAWNQSVPNLKGALEGVEVVNVIEAKDSEKDFQMIMSYSGKTEANSMGIDLDFTYSADFKWEKETGTLLYYDIVSDMEGTYNNTFSAVFSLDLRIERTDLKMNTVNFDFLFFITSLMLTLVVYRYYK